MKTNLLKTPNALTVVNIVITSKMKIDESYTGFKLNLPHIRERNIYGP